MAKQAPSRSIAPFVTVTILTSICVIPQGAIFASELAISPTLLVRMGQDGAPRHDTLLSADAVAEARWARRENDYVLAEGGRIVPQRHAPEIIAASTSSNDGVGVDTNHFDSVFYPAMEECGPSPVTPDEITRLVVEAAERHNVDAGFAVAVATAESRLDRLRNSPKGARGPMQLMPETAERFGVSDICDPAENVDGGIRYLRALTDEFRNPLLVAAAYNAGEGRVRQYGGVPPFKETLRYVADVLNIQMEREGSRPSIADPNQTAGGQRQPSNMTGVITTRDRRQWVGGVMHF